MTIDLDPLTRLSDALSGLVATAAPSVVSVHSHLSRSSGFLWKPGLIVTADEALAEEGEVEVQLDGGERRAAQLVGRDPTTDVALLRAETGDRAAVAVSPDVPAAGALCVAVGSREGHPLAGFGAIGFAGPAWRSMRGGEIDARLELALSMRREAEGAVVLDAGGRAIGMAVSGPRRRVLVIPSATIERVAGQLETRGRVARGYLGLGLQPVRLDPRGSGGGEAWGAMVMSVEADGPGARAGLHQGDVITAWNGEAIGSVQAMLRALGPSSVGTTVTLTLAGGGSTRTVELTIGERP